MTGFGDGFANDDGAPSRRDVVKYGAAAAIAAAVAPAATALAAAMPAQSRALFMRTAPAARAARRAIRALPACWCRTAARSSRPMPPGAIRCRSTTRASSSSSSRPAMRCRSTRQMLPRFYYIHQPAGSPQSLNLRYRGIDPTGPLPDSVDFALKKADEPQKFDVTRVHRSAAGKRGRSRFHPRRRGQRPDRQRNGRVRHDPAATSCSTICRSIRGSTASSARSACPGTISAAITISISRRRTPNIRARPSSGLRPALLRVRIWRRAVSDAR